MARGLGADLDLEPRSGVDVLDELRLPERFAPRALPARTLFGRDVRDVTNAAQIGQRDVQGRGTAHHSAFALRSPQTAG